MRISEIVVSGILKELEEYLLNVELPTSMLIQDYEQRLRRMEAELGYKNIQIGKLNKEIDLHIDTIKKWEPK
jgi:hypothetical protein